jgi:hypothetical protein
MHAGISKATAHEKVVVVGQSDLHNGTVLAHANSDDSEIGGVLHMRGAAKSRMCARNELHNLLEDLRKEADANLTNNASTNGKATHTGPGDASSAASPSLAGTAGKHGQQPLLPEATLAMAPEDEAELHPASVQVPGGRASAALTGGPSAALTGGRATATSTGGALAQAGESQQGLQPQASAGLGRSGPADQAAIMPPASGPASVQQAAQVLQPPARPAPPALPAPNSSAHAAADPAHDVASRLGRRAVVAAAAAAAPASDAAPAVSLPHPSATGLGSDCPEHWTAAPQGRQGAAPGQLHTMHAPPESASLQGAAAGATEAHATASRTLTKGLCILGGTLHMVRTPSSAARHKLRQQKWAAMAAMHAAQPLPVAAAAAVRALVAMPLPSLQAACTLSAPS